MDLHFISGFPRSGTTLLAAVLRQNPDFHAGMSSPVGTIYKALEASMASSNEASVFVSSKQREDILKGVFEHYYKDHPATVFDTNRLWTTRLPALDKLFPESKMVCCVRDLAWIIDSFERLYRKNPFEPSGIYGYDTNSTVYSRASLISGGSGVVGYAFNGLKEALAGEQAEKILLVEYEDLCKSPDETLKKIYNFIDKPHYQHDFDNVEYSAGEFDKLIGAKGLHDISGRVAWTPRKTILPQDLFDRYKDDQFWRQ